MKTTDEPTIFLVDDDGVLMTPHADHCLPGITRETVLEMAKEVGGEVAVNFWLAQATPSSNTEHENS